MKKSVEIEKFNCSQLNALCKMRRALNGDFVKYDHELSLESYLEFVGGFDFF